MRIEHKAARFMVELADALENLQSRHVGYGEFHVNSVRIHFDGEATEYSVEFDGDGAIWITGGEL